VAFGLEKFEASATQWRMNRDRWYKLSLVVIFLCAWGLAAVKPRFPHDWLLENYLVFIFVPLILLAGRYFRLSNLSYTLITIFMILHVIGAHYTYSEVPFGFTLQEWFGASRNMYDRVVHFSFGLLFGYPVREVFMRLSRAKGFWSYYFPVELTLAFSCIYEIIEWLTAARVDPAAGLAFLGTQGDVWDAQKDMLLAGIGTVLTMLVTMSINLRFNPTCWAELKASFRLAPDDQPLGETKLRELLTAADRSDTNHSKCS
jgi:putative membrane protein